jgi:hypothetical protein
MSKRPWSDNEEHNCKMMIEGIQGERVEKHVEPTAYVAPDKDQKWRARNVITIHWKLLGIKVRGSFIAIMAAVIDHANPKTGRCDASQWLIGRETGYSIKWVRHVLRWWATQTQFLGIEKRGRNSQGKFSTSAYHVQWDALEEEWLEIYTNIEVAKAVHRTHQGNSRVPTAVGSEGFPRSMGSTGLPPKHKDSTPHSEHQPERTRPAATSPGSGVQEEGGDKTMDPEVPWYSDAELEERRILQRAEAKPEEEKQQAEAESEEDRKWREEMEALVAKKRTELRLEEKPKEVGGKR